MTAPSPDKYLCSRSFLVRLAISVFGMLLLTACQATGFTRASFQIDPLAARVPGGGQLLLADIGGDLRADVLLMNRRPGRVYWFENPSWQFYQIPLMADELSAIAAHSLSAGSPASLTLAGRFSIPGSGTRDQLIWLQNPGRELMHDTWTATDIRTDVTPDALLWADLSGTGNRVLVASPELEVYTPTRARGWSTMSLLLESTPPITRLRAYDLDDDGREELLAAGPMGVDVTELASRGQFVDEFLLLQASGSGGFLDVAAGQSGPSPQGTEADFVAALGAYTPQLYVFRPAPEVVSGWRMEIVPVPGSGAHVLQIADLNQDGIDEIIVGGESGLQVFYHQAETPRWQRYALAASAMSDVLIADLNADGYPDIVSAPAEPGALLVFQNRGRRN
jgi:hypothetical protein